MYIEGYQDYIRRVCQMRSQSLIILIIELQINHFCSNLSAEYV